MWMNVMKNGVSIVGDVGDIVMASTSTPTEWADAGTSYGDLMILLLGPVITKDSADNLYLYWWDIPL